MKKKIVMIEESLNEFAKRGRPKKDKSRLRGIDAPDSWDDEDIEDEDVVEDIIDISDMTDVDEIDVDDDSFDDELMKTLSNEVSIPEYSRRSLYFYLKTNPRQLLIGIPMVKLGASDAFYFKLKDGTMKKIFVKDIILKD